MRPWLSARAILLPQPWQHPPIRKYRQFVCHSSLPGWPIEAQTKSVIPALLSSIGFPIEELAAVDYAS